MFNRVKFEMENFKITNVKTLPAIALLLLALVLWRWGAVQLAGMEASLGDVTQLRMESRPMDAGQVAALLEHRNLEREPVWCSAWTQREDIPVQSDALGYSIQVDKALFYSGDNDGIFEVMKKDACALSEQTASALFGSAQDALGQTVWVLGKPYPVERIAPAGGAELIAKAGEDSGMAFEVLNIRKTDAEAEAPDISTLVFREGIKSDLTIGYGSVIRGVRAIYTAILWIAVLAVLIFLSLRMTTLPRPVAVILGAAPAVLICCLCLGSPFYLPDSFIPTKWSEFEFWGQAAKRFSDAFSAYFAMKRFEPDTAFLGGAVFALAAGLLGSAAFVASGIRFSDILRPFLRERGNWFGFDYIKQTCQTIWKRRHRGE